MGCADADDRRALERLARPPDPIYDEGFEKYFCAHPWGMSLGGPKGCTQKDPDTGETLDVNCSKLTLCDSACACDAESCSPNHELLGGPTLEIQLVPPDADGDGDGLGGNVHTVHLKKQ